MQGTGLTRGIPGPAKPRRSPYWKRLTQGRYVGPTADTATPGTWLARAYNGEDYDQHPLGDFALLPANERYDAAKKAAEAWFQHLDMGGSTEPQSVKAACEAYVDKMRTESGERPADERLADSAELVYGDPSPG